MNFLVKVACLAHLHSCPIPGGYQMTVQMPNKQVCEQKAKEKVSSLAAQMGLAAADFRVYCQEK